MSSVLVKLGHHPPNRVVLTEHSQKHVQHTDHRPVRSAHNIRHVFSPSQVRPQSPKPSSTYWAFSKARSTRSPIPLSPSPFHIIHTLTTSTRRPHCTLRSPGRTQKNEPSATKPILVYIVQLVLNKWNRNFLDCTEIHVKEENWYYIISYNFRNGAVGLCEKFRVSRITEYKPQTNSASYASQKQPTTRNTSMIITGYKQQTLRIWSTTLPTS